MSRITEPTHPPLSPRKQGEGRAGEHLPERGHPFTSTGSVQATSSGQALGATGLRRELSRTAGKTTLTSARFRQAQPSGSVQGSRSSRASPSRLTPLCPPASRGKTGRVGSLLEACPECNRRVGTGFHPTPLCPPASRGKTGRENIYLNGAIPSMMLPSALLRAGRASLGMKHAVDKCMNRR